LTKEALAVATGVDLTTPRALELKDVVRPEFIVILLCFFNEFLVCLSRHGGSGFAAQGIKGEELLTPMAVGHLVNLALLAIAAYAINQARQDKSA
jgi:hypothetical protein